MIKIGILTFHWADNFGAVLQAYALQQTLISLGIDAKIINFAPRNLNADYRLFPNPIQMAQLRGMKNTALSYASRLRRFNQVRGRVRSFSDFRKNHLRLSGDTFDSIEKLKKVCSEFDICIVGSDQVWNPDFLSLCCNAYLLPFDLGMTRKVSYAASVSNRLTENWIELFKRHLKPFWQISVRERSTCNELSGILGRQIFHVADPTVLLTEDDYIKLQNNISNIGPQRYLLVYNFGTDPLPIAEYVANRLGLPIIAYSKPRKYQLSNFYREFSDMGPKEFLYLLKNAAYVVTNSFHGTVFSIMFEKPFITVPHQTRSIRMIELLNDVRLEDRIAKDISELSNDKIDFDIDKYKFAKETLKKKRESSFKFLRNIVNDLI